VCGELPASVPGIASWPASCKGKSSCTADCSEGWAGSVTVIGGPDNRWIKPLQTCNQEIGALQQRQCMRCPVLYGVIASRGNLLPDRGMTLHRLHCALAHTYLLYNALLEVSVLLEV
jgi:hypothetical protein